MSTSDSECVNGAQETSLPTELEPEPADASVAEQEEEEEEEESLCGCPEDLSDFVVIDEAEITESENEQEDNLSDINSIDIEDISSSDGATNNDLKESDDDEDEGDDLGAPIMDYSSDSEKESELWDCPPERRGPRTYREKDFHPEIPDPRCAPDWPLAPFWPVYISNFRMNRQFNRKVHCERAVQRYFASRGIPAFMVYQKKDTFYQQYQVPTGFLDMLVYFCCEKDANRAIQWCHQDMYYGHKLFVFSGRTPSYFTIKPPAKPESKTWRLSYLIPDLQMRTVRAMEKVLEPYGVVRSLNKSSLEELIVQFSMPLALDAFDAEIRFKAEPVETLVKRQRYLEQDVKDELDHALATSAKFMCARPKPDVLASLMHAVIPEDDRPWQQRQATKFPPRKQLKYYNPQMVVGGAPRPPKPPAWPQQQKAPGFPKKKPMAMAYHQPLHVHPAAAAAHLHHHHHHPANGYLVPAASHFPSPAYDDAEQERLLKKQLAQIYARRQKRKQELNQYLQGNPQVPGVKKRRKLAANQPAPPGVGEA